MNEELFFRQSSEQEKIPTEIRLLTELDKDKILDKWGLKMGSPNPWHADFKPVKKSREEKLEQRLNQIEMERNKANRGTVVKEIAAFFLTWREERGMDAEAALKIWEDAAGRLQDRGWPEMKDAILEALYDHSEKGQAA